MFIDDVLHTSLVHLGMNNNGEMKMHNRTGNQNGDQRKDAQSNNSGDGDTRLLYAPLLKPLPYPKVYMPTLSLQSTSKS